MKKLLLGGLMFLSLSLVAQYTISGKVLNADNQQPIISASVFLSNTSKGAVTNSNGEFVITNVSDGQYDLVASSVGFVTQVKKINTQRNKESLIFYLKIKELEEVVVGGYANEPWSKWGRFFIDNFIGQTPYTADCKIENTQTIHFRFFKKENKVKAIADEPLIIVNKALGYIVKYDLDYFECKLNSGIVLFQGYPFFGEMMPKRNNMERKWIERRKKVYYGSMMHFMRSLYRNNLKEDGFEVRKCIKYPNEEKKRVQLIFKNRFNIIQKEDGSQVGIVKDIGDSTEYYGNVVHQPDEVEKVFPDILPADSIAFAIDKTTAGLEFKDYLQIVYKLAKEDDAYLQFFGLQRKPTFPISLITLSNGNEIEILSNGLYFNPLDLLCTGYWSWSEKIATMLPFDYWPENK